MADCSKCFVCGKDIRSEHEEGNLIKCLLITSKFVKDIVPLVDRVLILNGAGARFRDGGYHHK